MNRSTKEHTVDTMQNYENRQPQGKHKETPMQIAARGQELITTKRNKRKPEKTIVNHNAIRGMPTTPMTNWKHINKRKFLLLNKRSTGEAEEKHRRRQDRRKIN